MDEAASPANGGQWPGTHATPSRQHTPTCMYGVRCVEVVARIVQWPATGSWYELDLGGVSEVSVRVLPA